MLPRGEASHSMQKNGYYKFVFSTTTPATQNPIPLKSGHRAGADVAPRRSFVLPRITRAPATVRLRYPLALGSPIPLADTENSAFQKCSTRAV